MQKLNPLHRVLLDLERRHFQDRQYRRVIATTEAVRSDLHRLYGVPHSDIDIIPNGFNPDEFNPGNRAQMRQAARDSLGLTNEFAILFVANELERKGYPTVLRALKALDGDTRLIVAGRPPVAEVMKLAAAEGVAGRVIAVGGARRIAELHAACDIMALPTQYEAFCLAILEALGSGLPVITTDVAGARDAVRDGVNGNIICDPFDHHAFAAAMNRYKTSSAVASASDSAWKSVIQYQWPKILVQYESILQSVATSAV